MPKPSRLGALIVCPYKANKTLLYRKVKNLNYLNNLIDDLGREIEAKLRNPVKHLTLRHKKHHNVTDVPLSFQRRFMSRIFLLRHAKAAAAIPGQRDFDRPLDSHGRETARSLGSTLMANGLNPDLVICSPAKRTRETLAIIAEFFAFEIKTRFDGSLFTDEWTSYLSALQSSDGANNVMIIGHNPAIEETALQLTNDGTRDALKALRAGFAPCSLGVFTFEGLLSELKPHQAFLENFLPDGGNV